MDIWANEMFFASAGQATPPQRLGILLGDWDEIAATGDATAQGVVNATSSNVRPYLPSRKVLLDPGLPGIYQDFFIASYDNDRECSYSYNIPGSAQETPGVMLAYRPNQLIPVNDVISPTGNFTDVQYGGYLNWAAIAACYRTDINWGQYDTSSGKAIPWPHMDQGVNVLFYDGSVHWIPKPSHIPPNIDPNPNQAPNLYSGPNGWPYELYNPGYPTGNAHDWDYFWPYVNTLY
jgi:prepilin-type processing-associated H-X9-DG protein